MSTQQGSNFVVRFIADLSRYNPAQRVQRENQAIEQSNQRLAQQTQSLAARLATARTTTMTAAQNAAGAAATADPALRRMLTERQAELARAFNQRATAAAATPASGQSPPRGGVFTEPGPHAGRRIGAITALPAGPSALVSSAFGQRAGQLTDIGVVGGLLPEGLSAGAAAVGVGVIAAGTALAALTKASISASRSLGTIESIQLDRALFGLRRQSRLLFAEIGQLLLPVLTEFTEALTFVVKGLRETFERLGLTEKRDVNAISAFGRDSQGRRILTGAVITPAQMPSGGGGGGGGGGGQQGGGGGGGGPNISERILDNAGLVTPYTPLQHGGIVLPQPGGVIAQLAEAGEAEAVIPLRQLGQMLGGRGGGMSAADRKELADSFQSALEQANALPPLWALHRQYDDQPEPQPDTAPVVNISGGGGAGGADNLQFVTKSAYDMLTDKSGIYAVYTA